eukprot:2324079-Pyramimonas_sp.AAC.1
MKKSQVDIEKAKPDRFTKWGQDINAYDAEYKALISTYSKMESCLNFFTQERVSSARSAKLKIRHFRDRLVTSMKDK